MAEVGVESPKSFKEATAESDSVIDESVHDNLETSPPYNEKSIDSNINSTQQLLQDHHPLSPSTNPNNHNDDIDTINKESKSENCKQSDDFHSNCKFDSPSSDEYYETTMNTNTNTNNNDTNDNNDNNSDDSDSDSDSDVDITVTDGNGHGKSSDKDKNKNKNENNNDNNNDNKDKKKKKKFRLSQGLMGSLQEYDNQETSTTELVNIRFSTRGNGYSVPKKGFCLTLFLLLLAIIFLIFGFVEQSRHGEYNGVGLWIVASLFFIAAAGQAIVLYKQRRRPFGYGRMNIQ